jgi:crotonobetainyl-CoA:carnitine CoA-transferase CaiB-like acyl-CoA transferase
LQPLAGVRIVDATSGIAGPLCGKLLADAGATVTTVETSGARRAPAPWQPFLARGKTSLDGNLEDALADAALYLCSGEHDDPALGCPAVLERHPGILAACVTDFGQAGPYATFRSDDLVLSALSGLADASPGFPDRQDQPGEPPVQSHAPLTEFGAGVVTAVAVLGALLARLGGASEPRHVEVSAHEAYVSLMVSEWGIAAYGGTAPGRTRKSRSLEPNCYLPCHDGYVVVVATTDRHWQGLKEAMGSPAWADDERFATIAGRAAHVDALHAGLRTWAAGVNGHDFMEAAQARGIPCTCLVGLRDAVASEHVAAVAAVERVDDTPFPADPIVVDGRRRRRTGDGDPVGLRSLTGIRVLDLGQMVAGPIAGQTLAALGADVIVVESRTRLTSRSFGPFAGEPPYEASSNFNHCNRGKRSVDIDLTTDAGRAALRQLVRTADVVIENYSRHAAARLGVTYAELSAERPELILASISAFGRTGPYGGYVSHHGGVTALSGLASVIRDDRGEPRLVGAIYPDVLTGTYAALAVLQALAERTRTGTGNHLEISMLDVLLNTMAGLLPDASTYERPHPGRFLPSAEPGRFLAVPAAHCAPELEAAVAAQPRRAAMTELQAAGVPAGAVLDMLEVIADPHLHARGFVNQLDHQVAGVRPLPGVPWLYDGMRPPLGVAPLLGADTADLLAPTEAVA